MTDLNEFIGALKTKPLELAEVACIFGIGNRRVADFLKSMPGVVTIGRRVRIPLIECPPEYLLDIGVLNSAKLSQSLQATKSSNTTTLKSSTIADGGNNHEHNKALDTDKFGKPVERLNSRCSADGGESTDTFCEATERTNPLRKRSC